MVRSVCALTLNPAVDRAYYVDGFLPGALNRASRAVRHAGGKGINISVLAARCGFESISAGFIAGGAGKYIEKFLAGEGVRPAFTEIPGETRTNIKIVDLAANEFTDLNEPGPPVTAADLDRLCAGFKALAQKSDIVVMGGSLPPGCPVDIYERLINIAKKAGAFTVLDAGGEELRLGLASKPHLIKPNLLELSLMLGYTPENPASAAREIALGGVETVLISLGAEGAVAATAAGAYHALPLNVSVKSTVGAGDCFLFGYIYGLCKKCGTKDALKYAVSFATSKIRHEGTYIPPLEKLVAHLDEAQILEGENSRWASKT